MVSPLKSFHVLDFENGNTFTFSTRKKKKLTSLTSAKYCVFLFTAFGKEPDTWVTVVLMC